MSEASIEGSVRNKAEAAGWHTRKIKYIGRRAAVDVLFFGHGRTVFIEFKKPGEKPKLNQLREHARLREGSAEVYWFDNEAAALECLGIAA